MQGTENVVADALSRRGVDQMECVVLTIVVSTWLQEVIDSYNEDIVVQTKIQELLLTSTGDSEYSY